MLLCRLRWASSPELLPTRPGSYILGLQLSQVTRERIGRLGEIEFPAGRYLYVGSAHGPGGLRARVARHWHRSAVRHWHIDYLRQTAEPFGVWWQAGREPRECEWARAVQRGGGQLVAPRFGASDCGCSGHLFLLVHQPQPPLVFGSRAGFQLAREQPLEQGREFR